MKKIQYFYYLVYVKYETGTQSVLGLRTTDSEYDLIELHVLNWALGFVGLSLTVDKILSCTLKEYNSIVTRITW